MMGKTEVHRQRVPRIIYVRKSTQMQQPKYRNAAVWAKQHNARMWRGDGFDHVRINDAHIKRKRKADRLLETWQGARV